MHKVLGIRATLYPATAMAKPAMVNAVCKLGRITLGAGRVRTLRSRVLVRVVAEELDPFELLAISAQGPRLPQSGA